MLLVAGQQKARTVGENASPAVQVGTFAPPAYDVLICYAPCIVRPAAAALAADTKSLTVVTIGCVFFNLCAMGALSA